MTAGPTSAGTAHVRLKGPASILAAAVLWGTVGPAQTLASGVVGPGALAGWRHLVGGVALMALCLPLLPGLRHGGRSLWVAVGTAGVVGAAYQLCFLTAVSRTGAALGTVLGVATVPLFSGLVARWADGERVSRQWVLGSGTAVAGCGILLLPGTSDRITVTGVGCGILAGALFAAYTVAAKRMAAHTVDVKATTGLSMLTGAVVLSPLMLAGPAVLVRPTAVIIIVWLGLVATALAYGLYSAGLRRASATTAGTLSLAEPLAAALLSTTLLGEDLSGREWAGCTVILGGLLLAVVGGRREEHPVPAHEVSVVAVGYVPMPVGVAVRPSMVGSRHVPNLGRAYRPARGQAPVPRRRTTSAAAGRDVVSRPPM